MRSTTLAPSPKAGTDFKALYKKLENARVYEREGEDFYLCCRVGPGDGAPIGYRVPRDYPAHVRTLEEGLVIIRPGGAPAGDDMTAVVVRKL